jgi:hypothetical protein
VRRKGSLRLWLALPSSVHVTVHGELLWLAGIAYVITGHGGHRTILAELKYHIRPGARHRPRRFWRLRGTPRGLSTRRVIRFRAFAIRDPSPISRSHGLPSPQKYPAKLASDLPRHGDVTMLPQLKYEPFRC